MGRGGLFRNLSSVNPPWALPMKKVERATHPLPRPSARSTTEQLPSRKAPATSFTFLHELNFFLQNELHGLAQLAAAPIFSSIHTYGTHLRKFGEHDQIGLGQALHAADHLRHSFRDVSSGRATALLERELAA
jgi:hypothetical protein